MSIQPPQQTEAESMIEVYMQMLSGKVNDPFIDDLTGTAGNYTPAEFYHQSEAFRQGMFAQSGMVEVLIKRAAAEAKHALVDAIINDQDAEILENVDYPEPGDMTHSEYYDEHVDKIWKNLGKNREKSSEYYQAKKVVRICGISDGWVPPHWRMLKFRHATSLSKGARGHDNLFQTRSTAKHEVHGDADLEEPP